MEGNRFYAGGIADGEAEFAHGVVVYYGMGTGPEEIIKWKKGGGDGTKGKGKNGGKPWKRSIRRWTKG